MRDSEISIDHFIHAWRADLVLGNKRKRKQKKICQIIDATASRMKLKECEKLKNIRSLAKS